MTIITFNSFAAKNSFMRKCSLDITNAILSESQGQISIDSDKLHGLVDINNLHDDLSAKIYNIKEL